MNIIFVSSGTGKECEERFVSFRKAFPDIKRVHGAIDPQRLLSICAAISDDPHFAVVDGDIDFNGDISSLEKIVNSKEGSGITLPENVSIFNVADITPLEQMPQDLDSDDMGIIYLTYDEPIADENFSAIKEKYPHAMRLHRVTGMTKAFATAPQLVKSPWYNRRVAVYTTLMGMTLKDADVIEGLFKDHPDNFVVFCLHLPDAKMNMKGYRRSDEYIEVLKRFLEMKDNGTIPAKKFEMMCMDPDNYHGQVHDDIKDLIPPLAPWSGHSRAGNLNEDKVEKIGATIIPKNDFSLVCSMTPFYDHNVVLPNGDVVLCCMDYSMKHVLGNLLDEGFTYYGLFKSEELEKVRLTNQKPCFSDESLCKTCNSVRRPSEYYVPK